MYVVRQNTENWLKYKWRWMKWNMNESWLKGFYFVWHSTHTNQSINQPINQSINQSIRNLCSTENNAEWRHGRACPIRGEYVRAHVLWELDRLELLLLLLRQPPPVSSPTSAVKLAEPADTQQVVYRDTEHSRSPGRSHGLIRFSRSKRL